MTSISNHNTTSSSRTFCLLSLLADCSTSITFSFRVLAESKYFGIKDGRKWTAVACSGHLCLLKFASGVEGHGQWSVRVTSGGQWTHTGHLATSQHGTMGSRSPVPGIILVSRVWTRQCPSSDEDSASHHHTAAISRHLLPSPPTTDAQQPPATDHNIVMFPRSLPHPTPHTSPLPLLMSPLVTGHF